MLGQCLVWSFIELQYIEMWTSHEGILLLFLWYYYTFHMYVTLHKHLFSVRFCFLFCFPFNDSWRCWWGIPEPQSVWLRLPCYCKKEVHCLVLNTFQSFHFFCFFICKFFFLLQITWNNNNSVIILQSSFFKIRQNEQHCDVAWLKMCVSLFGFWQYRMSCTRWRYEPEPSFWRVLVLLVLQRMKEPPK